MPNIPIISSGRTVPFRLGFATEWGLERGSIAQEFVLTLHDQAGTELDSMILIVRIDVPSAVALRIVGASGNNPVRRINLGILDPQEINRSDPFGLRIWSPAPYQVEFSSENMGKLRKTTSLATIPYSLRMSGAEIDLEANDQRVFPRGTGSLGDFHPLRVVVDPFFAEAGNYNDRIQVSVSAI